MDGSTKLGLHVDDILVKGRRSRVTELLTHLQSEYGLRTPQWLSEKNPVTFLAQRITMGYDEGGNKWYAMDAERLINDMAEKFDIKADDNIQSPMPNKNKISTNTALLTPKAAELYVSKLMTVMYIATNIRYDAVHPASRLSQQMTAPTKSMDSALNRLMTWLVNTKDKGIKGHVRTRDAFEYFVDSDHAGDRTLNTRSQTGIMILFNGVPVYWQSKRQPVTVLSSAEAEIYALSEAMKAAKLTQCWRAQDLGIQVQWSVIIQVGNKASISFQHSTCPNGKLLGTFDLRDQWVQEMKDNMKIVQTVKVPTLTNLADLFTKCHSDARFKQLMEFIDAKARLY